MHTAAVETGAARASAQTVRASRPLRLQLSPPPSSRILASSSPNLLASYKNHDGRFLTTFGFLEAPRGPKEAPQEAPKRPPRRPKEDPRGSKTAPKRLVLFQGALK